MNAAFYFADGREVTVKPVAVRGGVDWTSFYVADDVTGVVMAERAYGL